MLNMHGTMTSNGKCHIRIALMWSSIMCKRHKKKGEAKTFTDIYLDIFQLI